jgi:carbonyl reductase 1
MSIPLNGIHRIALVTGGNKGIGYEIVRQLATADPHCLVLLGSRDNVRGESAVSKLGLPNVTQISIDVTSHSSIQAAAVLFKEKHSHGLDLLVNNAGVYFKNGRDSSGKIEDIDATLSVNYYGVRDTCNLFWPLLNKNARVINVSSQLSLPAFRSMSAEHRAAFNNRNLTVQEIDELVTAYRNSGGNKNAGWNGSAYGFSKVAVCALSRVLARDAQNGITVNSACPGWCHT